jgi:diguanylate cyclase (GGDEF)-like protein
MVARPERSAHRRIQSAGIFEQGTGMARCNAWRLLLHADLDGIKRINDEQGHAAGDHALKAYAEVVRRNIRSTDLLARVAGDEFLVFMKIKDPAFAPPHRRAFARGDELHPLCDGGVSRCSLGALIIPPGRQQIDDLVRQADAVMYAAKVMGAALQGRYGHGSAQPFLGRPPPTSRAEIAVA